MRYFDGNLSDGRFLIDKHQYIDITRLHDSELLAAVMEQGNCTSFMIPHLEKAESGMRRFRRINPTFFEFAYMSHMMLWSTLGKRPSEILEINFEFSEIPELEDSTYRLAESIQTRISEDLHNYYIEAKPPCDNYASRQAKLFRTMQAIRCSSEENNQLYTAVKMFNFDKKKIPCCPFVLNFVEFFNKLSL